MNQELAEQIGKKIRERRVQLGYSQFFLSQRLHKTQHTVSNIENGKSELTIARIIEIAEILKVDLNYFIELERLDEKDSRIEKLEDLITRLEKRNEILEDYILQLVKNPKEKAPNNEQQ